MEAERNNYRLINFEETELRLGLPGGSNDGEHHRQGGVKINNGSKRGFVETVDLKLNFSNSKDIDQVEKTMKEKNNDVHNSIFDPAKPSAPKAQVVGWPPVRSFRKNIVCQKQEEADQKDNSAAAFVKVSMDGAPYLRKVDLKMYKSYQELSLALSKMFSSFTIGNCAGSQGILNDFRNERKLIDVLNGSEYVPSYEDKDGDWMLVGDVPWEMFVDSCKRLRIMKGSEAIGLAPQAVEKCKRRS